MIEELVARVFHTRNMAHLEHWATQSYSQHMALGSFYDDIIGAIDDIVETFQGYDDLIGKVKVISAERPKDIAKFLDDEVNWIKENRDTIADGSTSVGNLLDSLMEIYFRTIYKLDNLK